MSAQNSSTALAILIPSKVEVPLPISSRINRLFEVAFFTILATSLISTIKVDCPEAKSSDAPTRVKMLSTMPISADDAGTKLPICAISTIRAIWRIYVDLPAILGPVMIATLSLLLSRYTSFGTNGASFKSASTTG